ncbi:hypothetical protein N0V93_003567 [Gnomoniopsis smithogilvyi]|uniref:Uncharacterized protein n=1 Tax=Gnomoniopsis smithogilvyi TaxID=1191159 RepID=A0A9W8YWW8_9PEZI|nr:hypothetical protein N0V93_003567 [Gnomoniopsis smithogilvyi]
MMTTPKIFVGGSVNGQLEPFFTKLSTVHSKHNFSFAIVVGDLFAVEDGDSVTALLSGKIEVPVTTYFTVGTRALPARIVEKILSDEGEICPNLHYLNKSSITKTSEGVRIVALGGVLDPEILGGGQSKEQHLPYHTSADAKTLRGANSADILLTCIWPSLVWNGSQQALPFDPDTVPTSDDIADLCATLKPRYHFCPSPGDFGFDRTPFFHAPPDPSSDPPVTRFVSLAPFGNAQKAKAMTAFSLAAPGPIPTGSTVSPFLARSDLSRKRTAPLDEGFSRFSNGHHEGGRQQHRSGRGNKRQKPGPDVCFFCLNSENSENHMVCSIGDESYLATAKGPLTTSSTYAEYGLDYPAHMIITPIAHVSSISGAVMGQEEAERTFKEMARFRESLQAAVSKISKHKLGAVTWEINRDAGVHVHWQFLPVPADLITKGLVEAAFKVEAENLKLPGLVAKDFGLADEVPGDYVRVWIWYEDDGDDGDGGKIVSKCLLMRFDRSVRFDLQYPRKVMAKLLKLEARTIWQECTQTTDEEASDTTKFRVEAFKPWDFTLMD